MMQYRKSTRAAVHIILFLVPVILYFLQLLGRISAPATILAGVIICVKAAVEIMRAKSYLSKREHQVKNQIIVCPVKAKCEACGIYTFLTPYDLSSQLMYFCKHCYLALQ